MHMVNFVAFSRVKRLDDVKIVIIPSIVQRSDQIGHYTSTINVVYRKILLHIKLIINKYYFLMLPTLVVLRIKYLDSKPLEQCFQSLILNRTGIKINYAVM